jgi:hypothetical protein
MECSHMLLGAFILIMILIWRRWAIYGQLRAEGIVVEAKVVDHQLKTNEDGFESYYITCWYLIDVNDYTKKFSVNEDVYQSLPPGSVTQVVCLPRKPEFVRHISKF